VISFDQAQWQHVRELFAAWRQNNNGLPMLGFMTPRDPGRSAPAYPGLVQANCTDFSVSPETIVDTMEYQLSCYDYHGAAYPRAIMHAYGPGVLACFVGGDIRLSSTGNVWFTAPQKPIEKVSIRFDPDSKWFRRIASIYEVGAERLAGKAVMAMTDLGGAMDVVATMVGTTELLYALVDCPEEVERLMAETHTAWMQAYDTINEIIKDMPGFSDWFGVYYPEPGGYMLQSDFSYMIGPKDFRRFVQPELTACARELKWPNYHWDGIGELPHFQALMEIKPQLQGVQWVPGDGQPPQNTWTEVLKSLGDAGRKLLCFEGLEHLDDYLKAAGPGQIFLGPEVITDQEKQKAAMRLLKQYSLE